MSRFLCIVSLVATCTLVGCGGGDGASGGVPVFPVSGSVKMLGSPLANATVAFAPQGDQPTAVGTTDAQGNFQLTTYEFGDGAAEGSYKIVISKSSAPAGGGGGGGQEGDHEAAEAAASVHSAVKKEGESTAQLVPAQYTSGAETPLTAEVKSSGENVFNLEIK